MPKTIPVGMHADGAPITKHDGLFTLSWNSLLPSGGTTLETRLVFTCIKKSDIGPGTVDAIFSYFAWAMNVLSSGVTPTHDWTHRRLDGGGQYLVPGGWRASLIQCRGDWEFYANYLGLPRWDTDNCCWLCKASLSDERLLWTDTSPDAPFRRTLRSHESFLAELSDAGKQPSPLFNIVGLRLEGIMICTLHTVELGVASHIIANNMVDAMKTGCYGPNQKIQAERMARELKDWYREQPKEIKSSKIQ
eukprot:7458372-Pyramimonas_sp.AAC.1